ncbi:MAG: sigma-70 family RNA polymerase sigma factor [Planctomycetota bacterium]|nr:sigma-70 family RNA polymerase sigma factor [Planctomycetota bacterium]
MAKANDQELIARAKAGDEDAYRLLFERYSGPLRKRVERWLPRAIQRKVSVSDVMQEARLTAFQRFSHFEDRGDGSFRKWLQRIAENKVRAEVQRYAGTRKRAVQREVSRGYRPDTANVVGQHPSPSQAAIGAELKELARQAMETLPPDYRAVLRLALEERLRLREVAERMNRSRDAVKKLYGRALCRFKDTFDRLRGESHA